MTEGSQDTLLCRGYGRERGELASAVFYTLGHLHSTPDLTVTSNRQILPHELPEDVGNSRQFLRLVLSESLVPCLIRNNAMPRPLRLTHRGKGRPPKIVHGDGCHFLDEVDGCAARLAKGRFA